MDALDQTLHAAHDRAAPLALPPVPAEVQEPPRSLSRMSVADRVAQYVTATYTPAAYPDPMVPHTRHARLSPAQPPAASFARRSRRVDRAGGAGVMRWSPSRWWCCKGQRWRMKNTPAADTPIAAPARLCPPDQHAAPPTHTASHHRQALHQPKPRSRHRPSGDRSGGCGGCSDVTPTRPPPPTPFRRRSIDTPVPADLDAPANLDSTPTFPLPPTATATPGERCPTGI
jgi:hypothetical protein